MENCQSQAMAKEQSRITSYNVCYTKLLRNFFRYSGLLTGGTPGLTFLAHYASGWSYGLLYFLLNIPFYFLGLRALGKAFTLKTFGAVLMLSVFSEMLPRWFAIASSYNFV